MTVYISEYQQNVTKQQLLLSINSSKIEKYKMNNNIQEAHTIQVQNPNELCCKAVEPRCNKV
jgi:hypothetical protein